MTRTPRWALTRDTVAELLEWNWPDMDNGYYRWTPEGFKGTVLMKIWVVLRDGLISFDIHGWHIHPIPGYNSDRRVAKDDCYDVDFEMKCTCTGYKKNGACSHQKMVFLWRKLLALEDQGFRIIRHNMIATNTGGGDYVLVRNDAGIWRCSCPYHRERNVACKHMLGFEALRGGD